MSDEEFERAYKHIDDTVRKIHTKAAIELDRLLVQKTPVDTGRAKNNWTFSINEPDVSFNMARTKSRKNTAISKRKDIKPYTVTYTSNHLPYIERLNDGHSQQAPRGFIQSAVNLVKRVFK